MDWGMGVDVKNVAKIRILGLLSKHGFLSAKVIANRTRMPLDDVASTLLDLIKDGSVYADDTGRDWGGEPVIVFMATGSDRKASRSAWAALSTSIRGR